MQDGYHPNGQGAKEETEALEDISYSPKRCLWMKFSPSLSLQTIQEVDSLLKTHGQD